jgi:endoglucanase
MPTPLRSIAFALSWLVLAGTTPAAEQVVNGGFEAETTPWWATQNLAIEIRDGELCAAVPAPTINPWDAIIGQDGFTLVKGEGYTFSFRASGEPQGPVRALVQMPRDPYTSYVSATPTVMPEGDVYAAEFTSPVDMEDAQIVFQVGGSINPWTLCLDDVSLQGGTEVAAYVPDTGPRVRVNQLGYLPDGPKKATIVTDAAEPLPFEVRDGSGAVVLAGTTVPRGMDDSAGGAVHTADFSALEATGTDFTVTAGGDISYPFAIDGDLYDPLRIDALSYYYPVRSGIEIDAAIAGEGYGRPAGHVGVPPNKGDTAVPCQAPESSARAYGEPWTCDYTLDVTGGWYDAGDHGKYVVNGGISVAQLMSAYERGLHPTAKTAWLSGFEDGSLRIPEHGGSYAPDVLDEVRWELEFFEKMVVPEGEPLAGMVHHKIHDNEWTGIPLMPHLDDKVRELHRPSTAATLNVAATFAQAARVFRAFDEAFADRMREKAIAAWEAAVANPALYAPVEDGNSGGGPYNDDDVSDEFYWAAANLWMTTGEQQYYDYLRASPHWDGDVFRPEGFDWGHVAGLARIQLARGYYAASAADIEMFNDSVVAAADALLETQAAQPFGHPYAPPSGLYDWGSTHLVIQNALVIATAYDITGDTKYRDGALEAMDYVLGRNALNMSYVTGYGTKFSENQHSRWFAHQANAELPHPPRGSLAGGPNSSIQDPVAQQLFGAQGCAPQTCYVDHIESWSTNEITINWNAALSQMASWLADL